jgi:His-Xaa-Ser system radical SAM maturase HxsB
VSALAKRFRTLDHYREPERAGYNLLPLRFTALDDRRVVVSNMAGEYLVTDRATVHALIQHRIPAGSPLYDDLKSRHFIYNADSRAALELLGLKYRTKLNRVAQFTGLHMFVVTLRCDYTCKYCQVSRQTEDRVTFDMPAAVAERAVDFVFRSPSRAIKIEFQGGEPLLNFERIQHIVQLARERNRSQGRDLKFVIASNLSPLNEDILAFSEREGIDFSTSLDGPATLHNANRPRPGRNGYDLTTRGIRQIQSRLGIDRISALMTTTDRSLTQVREIIDEYLGFGFNSIFLRPLSPYGFAVTTGQVDRYTAAKWLAFYKEGIRYILELNRRGIAVRETYTAIVLRKMLTPLPTGYVDLQSPAGIGISGVVYNYDGDVYASDEGRMLAEMGDKSFRLGNVATDRYEDMLLSDALLDPLQQSLAEGAPLCSDCAFVPYCGSDPVYHHATQGNAVGNKALSGFCHRNMEVFRHLITLMEDSPADREILKRWAFG